MPTDVYTDEKPKKIVRLRGQIQNKTIKGHTVSSLEKMNYIDPA